MIERSSFEELHCTDKHISGAIVQVTEIMEKLADMSRKNKDYIKYLRLMAQVRAMLNDIYNELPKAYYPSDHKYLIGFLIASLHKVRTARTISMQVAREVISSATGEEFSIKESAIWQEFRDLKGDLWNIEKHLSDDIQKLERMLKNHRQSKESEDNGVGGDSYDGG